jgi:hypothetical protein
MVLRKGRSGMGPTRRSVRVAIALFAALIAFVVVANLLWPELPPSGTTQPRVPPTVDPFPVFRMGATLHVVTLPTNANLSTRLLMTSMQGLINRNQTELYLDADQVAGNPSRMLSFLGPRYGVRSDGMSIEGALAAYSSRARGLVVYDPTRPESVNIGTIMSAQRDAFLVGPDQVQWVAARTGLPVLFDYASRNDWTSLTPIDAYDRAMRDLYPSSTTMLLAILPPDRWAIRDYLVATRTFVFYFPQGILASPFESAATKRILHATPRGIPILGWFNSPTLTEENSFVQMASAEGKFVVGVQSVPNLTVLTALGRNETRRQASSSALLPTLQDHTTYAVLAVPDGDNLDFAAGRMWDLWTEPTRSALPFAWSLNPILGDLAPPLRDMYYDSATSMDQFIAAPSGAGYLYPDYATADDLSSFVAFSRRYMNASDMNVVWLLNAFTASEIPYSSRGLRTYVEGLHPNGIVLDYADQPKTRDWWGQDGRNAFAPVIRSTHFWTTRENVLGKFEAASETSDPGPRFLWLTVYTFRFNLADGLALRDALSTRLGGRLEVVTPQQFFALLRLDFVRGAKARLTQVEANPVASLFFGAAVESARAHVREADGFLVAGRPDLAASAAFHGLEDLRTLDATAALIASLGVLLVAGALAYLAGRSRRGMVSPRESVRFGTLVFLATSIAILLLALREVLSQNFWTYPTVLLGIVACAASRPLRRVLDAAYPNRAPLAAALVSLVLSGLAIRTVAAFPLALIGTLLALDTYLSRRPAGPEEMLAGLGIGTAAGFIGGFDLPTFAALAVLFVASSFGARGPARPDRVRPPVRPFGPALLMALSLSGLAVAFYYSFAVRLGLQGDALAVLAATLLVLGPGVAILVRRIVRSGPPAREEFGGLLSAAIFGVVLLFVSGTLATLALLVGLLVSLSVAALASLDRFVERGGEPRRVLAIAILLLPLLVLFYRMPPIVYSLLVRWLPEPVEYALYAPSVLWTTACLALAALVVLEGRRRTGLGKHYRAAGDGGTVPP